MGRRKQSKVSEGEMAYRKANLKTQGREGCKAERINMAFTPDNYNFIKRVSRASGLTMTEYCNRIVAAYRNEHPEVMKKALEFDIFVKAVENIGTADLALFDTMIEYVRKRKEQKREGDFFERF